MPSYLFSDFKLCCIENPKSVIPWKDALDDASYFGLKTKSALLNFIGNDGLENLMFINTKKWEENPNKSLTIFVDAYEFTSLYRFGYIAFFYNKNTGYWNIKSFKPSKSSKAIFLTCSEC